MPKGEGNDNSHRSYGSAEYDCRVGTVALDGPQVFRRTKIIRIRRERCP